MKYASLLLALLASLYAAAQATLPTDFDFATTPSTLPTGWSTNTTSSYSSGLLDNNGTTSRAGKLQSTGHFVMIEFFDDPGSVVYNIRSYGTNTFMGTFIVEESVNGTNWSTLHNFGNGDFNDSWTTFTETPNPASRFIRFNLSNKVSGTNVGLDDVSISAFTPMNEEINVVYNGANAPSGTAIQFASSVGTTLDVKLGVENLGTSGTLQIGAITFSGNAAGDYSVASAPSSIGPSSSDTVVVTFDPSATGNRYATINITNSDANEDPYILNLEGIGGSTSSEPSASPSSLSWIHQKTYRLTGSFSTSDAENYLVLFSKSPITAVPQDGTGYELGQGFGGAKVAHAGPGSQFEIRESVADEVFHIRVFGYNGTGQFANYRTGDPLIDSVQTPEATMENSNYYQGVDPLQSTFVQDLHGTINPHSVRFYSNYGPDMVPKFLARDTTNGQKVITGVYSSEQVVYDPPFGWPETGMNREHTLPASWMPSAGNQGTPEYQDFHHLFPTISTTNSQRSNHPLGEVVNVTNSYMEGKVGTDANGNTVYEPWDAQKGDAARAIMYMQTAYHNAGGGSSWGLNSLNSNGPNQDVDVLLQWHYNDLPSAFEHARNDFIDSLQKNRNPFVDSAHWVCYIDFETMSYKSSPDSACLAATMMTGPGQDTTIVPTDTTDSTIGIYTHSDTRDWRVFPNPASELLHIQSDVFQEFDYEIISMEGKSVKLGTSRASEQLSVADIEPGIYILRISAVAKAEPHFLRLVIQ